MIGADCRSDETMTVIVAVDRSMCVQPYQVVRTGWIDIDLCKLGCRVPMNPEAVEKKFRRLLNLGECAPWPPIVGHWEDGRFLVDDGRHEYLAALMIGRDKLFVCWLEGVPPEPAPSIIADASPIAPCETRADKRLPAATPRSFRERVRALYRPMRAAAQRAEALG